MIANFFKAVGGSLTLIIFIVMCVVLMYVSYIFAIGLFIIGLIYAAFTVLEVFRTSK